MSRTIPLYRDSLLTASSRQPHSLDLAYCSLKRWQHRHDRVHLMHYDVPWARGSAKTA